MNAFLVWLMLMALFWLGWVLGGRFQKKGSARREPEPASDSLPDVPAVPRTKVSPYLALTGHRSVGGAIEFTGTLRGSAEEAFAGLRDAFADEPVTPMLLEGWGPEVRVLLVPRVAVQPTAEEPKWWLHWLLFGATVVTTTWAGALHAGVNLVEEPWRIAVGLPYGLGLLAILGAHELGHYFTARRHGVEVTPPFFIPIPFALGTFGAFIKIKSLTPNRRALFDVAVAGPLAGLVFAVPALWIGLGLSQVVAAGLPTDAGHMGIDIGSSVLMAFLAKLTLGASVSEGHRLLLHPLAFAGWLGLLVTALNLLPIGQLDGGHIAHAMFGSRNSRAIGLVALLSLFLLALFVWPGLMMWAFIVFFIAGTSDAPAADDVSPVDPWRRALGVCTFLLLVLIVVPVPHSLYQAFGIHCPYL